MSSLGRQDSGLSSLAAQSQQKLATLAAEADANSQKKKAKQGSVSKHDATPATTTVGFAVAGSEAGASGEGQGQSAGKTPNKTMSKAERRAIQEAQRAAKAERLAAEGKGAPPPKGAKPTSSGPAARGPNAESGSSAGSDAKEKVNLAVVGQKPQGAAKEEAKQKASRASGSGVSSGGRYSRLGLFSHLPINTERSSQALAASASCKLHPAVVRLGLAYNRGVIVGSNARCRVMMEAFKEMIASYEAPPDKDFGRELEQRLRPHIGFLSDCRPMASSMRNAIKFLKMLVVSKTPKLSDAQAREEILEDIDTFIRVRIDLADDEITAHAVKKIVDGDVVLTYACSHVVQKILVSAHEAGRRFKVIVVDSRPRFEGRQTLERLSSKGIQCSYVLINGASYVMKEATKVLLGAATFFTNGHMLSRVGTSVIAMMAKSFSVPVIVCCETYKFWDRRVQTDSFVYNEVDDPEKLVATVKGETNTRPLEGWKEHAHLHPLNLLYDVTPPNFIDMVITEVGLIPCTSVPVVLREYDITKNII
eukprot:comp21816_c0_seq1/m.31081 comp21816_c0_seq1/g.31081  ORF comp21816_c0_seq1/g.31081 comp21816_c0_seq1/m.31081 type:complete len:535 (-) comp21816_c0_seq1:206-1810(-)